MDWMRYYKSKRFVLAHSQREVQPNALLIGLFQHSSHLFIHEFEVVMLLELLLEVAEIALVVVHALLLHSDDLLELGELLAALFGLALAFLLDLGGLGCLLEMDDFILHLGEFHLVLVVDISLSVSLLG